MIRVTPVASAVAAVLFAAAAPWLCANAAEPPPGARATRAEIQIGLCAPPEKIEQALDLRPRGRPITVWLFDDAALTLFKHGLRLRLRDGEGRSELTLKVADQDCARLAALPPDEGKCEYDVHGTSMAGAVSLTQNLSAGSANDLRTGRVAPAQVLSPSQVKYLQEVVGIWPLPLDLRALGPIHVRTFRAKAKPYDVDVSLLPTGEQYVEISRKVPVADAIRAKGVLEGDLSRAGVEMCADQSAQAINKLRSLQR